MGNRDIPIVNSRQALHPGLLWPRRWRAMSHLPFDQRETQYFYMARNAIYAYARQKLAGQEILFPSYCHGVELEALVAAGVVPRYYRVRGDMRVDVDDVAREVRSQTRGVYLIHYLGFPGPIEELQRFCRERGLLLFEDCALSLLSSATEHPLGSYGDAAVFCLYKTLPLPHGGALCTSEITHSTEILRRPSLNSTLAYAASSLQHHYEGRGYTVPAKLLDTLRRKSRSSSEALGVRPVARRHFDPADAELGMSEICRWIVSGLDLDKIVEVRRRNFLYLLERLQEFAAPIFPDLPPGVCPLFYPIAVDDKEQSLRRLWEAGIQAVSFWSSPPALIPERMFPETDALRRTIIELPCHQDLTIDHMDRIADVVLRGRVRVTVA